MTTPLSKAGFALLVGSITYLLYPSPDSVTATASPSAPAYAGHPGPSFALPTPAHYAPSNRAQNHVFNMDASGELVVEHDTAPKLDMLVAVLPMYLAAQELRRAEEMAATGLSVRASIRKRSDKKG